MAGELVLVTGGTGFLGSHCIAQALAAGYKVRTTVRSTRRAGDVRAMVAAAGVEAGDRLSFAEADLSSDAGWNEAAAGCAYALHVASPFPPSTPRHEDELIVPARDGALRLLLAAREAGVKRVVLTSSFAAIGYGHGSRSTPFTEADWTNLDGRGVSAYVKSKTIAERAAWDFIAREGGSLELSVINPVLILGPALAADTSTSIILVKRMLKGEMPGCPRMRFGVVDVRDTADLHLRAMTNPAAKGERFLAVAEEFVWMTDMARMLKERMGAGGALVKTSTLPDWMVKLVALGDKEVAQIVPELGIEKNARADKARNVLGWSPRPNAEATLASAESLIKLGIVGVKKAA
ncbi:MAG: aldehyde reductase [Hyphomonadaceae bacterium]|nr:aldehyde reductase [Hyphomonadaceae bacterium]